MKLLLPLLLLLVGCQDYNSNSSDRFKYGPAILDETDPNFAQAYNTIQTRCTSCHSSNIHDIWATYKNNNAWLDSGLIQRGDPDNSYFIQRIINYGGASSNMPQGGSALSDAEYQQLRKWVEEIP
ncbi:hypothetical protein ACJVC5_08970 [Peredibacter sp. HCB2-198]|uniref:hypothetical protein n=1 Tax=Peredibacter sp. HCB2-198 TaxID=3383025 RepID=UPI0038B5377A